MHSKERARTHHLVPAVQEEILERTAGQRTILNLVKDKTCFIGLDFCRRERGGNAHDDRRYGHVGFKELLVIRVFAEIQIHHVLKMTLRKSPDTAGFAALTNPFYHKGLMLRLVQPIFQNLVDFSLKHIFPPSFLINIHIFLPNFYKKSHIFIKKRRLAQILPKIIKHFIPHI